MRPYDLLLGLSAGLDHGAVAVFRRLGARGGVVLGPEERIERLGALTTRYGRPEWGDPEVFFPVPAVDPREEAVRTGFAGVQAVDLTWDRAYEPVGEDIAEEYVRLRPNLRFVARWFRGPGGPRPTVVLVHGYQGGRLEWEQRIFPVRRMLERGLDVVLPVLPFHGPRRAGGVNFPGVDPRWNIEAFRHAVTDLRALFGLIRARGARRAGVWGMSLGGYTTSLLATVQPGLDFAVPIIPLASIGDYALQHGRLVGTSDQIRAQHEGLEAVYRVVSPLARPSRVPADRMLVLAGSGDRITGPAHAERLAAHFGCPIEIFEGSHLLQFGLRSLLERAIALSLA